MCWWLQVKAVELFAGAGGAALGLHAAGVEHLRCVEWDKDAAATLGAAGFPAVCGDVRDLSLCAGLEPDLVWSSFPCQCWSSAGKRLGPEDDRNGWPWTVDAIDAMSPRWFVAENVTGLTQHRGECASGCVGPELCPRAYLDRVILAQLRERFPWVACRVLNASSYGVPQHRRRLIIVAGPRPIDWPAPTHGKPTGQGDLFGRKLLPWRTVCDALGLSGLVHTGGIDYRFRADRKTRERPRPTDEPSPTVSSAANMMLAPPAVGRHTATLADGPGRRLAVQECAALQDFPPDHPWQGNQEQRYRQVGNAVPPTLARVVAEAVLDADAI